MKESKRKTCIYLRVSTTKQSEDGYGMDAQQERCIAYCKYRGIPNELINIIADGGYSGGNIERPAFQKFLHDCENNIYERIIIYKLDRISRSVADFCKVLDFLIKNDVELISVSENLDLSTAVGSLIAKILVVFAEYERKLDIERTNEAIIAMLNQGYYPFGGKIMTLGYEKKDRTLIVNEEQKLVYFDLITTFFETKSISQTYVEMLLKHPEIKWTMNKISYILRNKIYLGGVQFKNKWYPNLHQPLISQTEFDKIQTLLASHAKDRKYIYLLKGLMFCAECGEPMSATCAHNHQGRVYLYYYCKKCKKSINEKKVLAEISAKQLANCVDTMTKQEADKEMKNLTRKLNSLTQKQNELFNEWVQDKISWQFYVKSYTAIEKEKRPFKRSLDKTERLVQEELLENFNKSLKENQYVVLHKGIKEIKWSFAQQKIKEIIYLKKNQKNKTVAICHNTLELKK